MSDQQPERLFAEHVGKPILPRHEVFVVGGQPTVTYNPRTTLGLDARVKDYLEEGGRVLVITGPTKSGKTVLVRRTVKEAVRISGGDLESVDAFWSEVADAMGSYAEESAERTWTEGRSHEADARAAAKIGGSGIDIGMKEGGDVGEAQGRTKVRRRDPRRTAKAELRERKATVVIDDFHHVVPEVQRQIVRGVKDLVFDGVRIILVAVPHRAGDVVRGEPEMQARVEQLQIKPWSIEELDAIASLGFDALNVTCPDALARRLAEEAYGSPHLMQDFCLHICKLNNIRQTAEEPLVLSNPDDLTHFFRRMAEEAGQDETYRRLAQGPRHRTDRKKRKLKTGETTDLYGVVLSAIASTGPKVELDWVEIRAALRNVMADEPPRKNEYTSALEHMSKLARELVRDAEHDRFVGDPALDYDETLDKLHISDPFFAFQLRWSVRKGNGSTPADGARAAGR